MGVKTRGRKPPRFGLVLCCGLLILLAACSQSPQIVIESSQATKTPTVASPSFLFVHVAGEVKIPGLYRLFAGARVDDALKAAGGITEDGDPDALNLAALLRDGEKVTVPAKGATVPDGDLSGGSQHFNASQGSISGKVNINQAGVQELESLPGIGEVLAQRILDYRARNGGFERLEQLMEVAGIGQKRFEAIRDLISLD